MSQDQDDTADDLADLSANWALVQRFLAGARLNTTMPLFVSHTFANFAHALVLVHALAVLQQALIRFRDLGRFPKCGRNLKALLDSSENHLEWLDLPTIREAKSRRDGIAHRLEELERAQVWTYVRAIEKQLQHWGIVSESDAMSPG